MDSLSSKYKSTVFTLDTFGNNSSTFGLSIFQKDIIGEGLHANLILSHSQQNQFNEDEHQNVFSLRSRIDYRQRYLYRVLGDKENQSLPSIKHQHGNLFVKKVFIFDWDDTLLCTTYLKSKKSHELSEDVRKYLKQLDDIVLSVLDNSVKKGFVFIITNALDAWIKQSSKAYLPKVYEKIFSCEKIMIWSARQLFEQHFPDNIKMWKVMAFKKLKHHLRVNVDNFVIKILTNVICVGDRQDDLEACDVLMKDFELIYVKKIKLQERPRPEQLIKELKLLEKKFQQIFHAIANTTIKLQKRVLTPENIRKNSGSESPEVKMQKRKNQ